MITKNTKAVKELEATVNGMTARYQEVEGVIRVNDQNPWIDMWLTHDRKESGIVVLAHGIFKSSADRELVIPKDDPEFNVRMFAALTAIYEVYNALHADDGEDA
jgi:hypothetical protein